MKEFYDQLAHGLEFHFFSIIGLTFHYAHDQLDQLAHDQLVLLCFFFTIDRTNYKGKE